MQPISIQLTENLAVKRTCEPVRFGVPLAAGEVFEPRHLTLMDSSGKQQPLQVTPLATWPDGSAKWLLCDTVASVPANQNRSFHLSLANTVVGTPVEPKVYRTGNDWVVETGAASFYLDADNFRPFNKVEIDGREILNPGASTCFLTDADGQNLDLLINDIQVENQGPVRTTLCVKGYLAGGGEGVTFIGRLHFYRDRSLVKIDFTLRNTRPANHPGGLWDLGDKASILFTSFELKIATPADIETQGLYTLEKGDPQRSFDPNAGMKIYQESSGGSHWDGPNHRNRAGDVPLSLKGYRVESPTGNITRGDRATPVVWCGRADKGIAVTLPNFWQEFPKALSASSEDIRISLFPKEFPDLHELQGGEQKTHTFYIDFASTATGLDWVREPLIPVVGAEVFKASGAGLDLPDAGMDSRLEELLAEALSGENSFLAKRDAIDEYGWRNFGEIYADHEAVNHPKGVPFISHYNNQYDPINSFYLQFMATSDPRWSRLAFDLARHVIDIDIYHTDGDREEYNNGLFWHTDHYIEAGTATHRTHSREHLKKKDPRFCGGGPAAEHCYTSGLVLHYYLTGDIQARQAVIDLAEWSILSLGGDRTLLSTLLQAKKTIVRLKMSNPNEPVAFPKYPLTRGTGNAMTACLNAFELTGNRRYLSWCETFIRGTVHPADDIDVRNLLNAELGWSYTVFLVAVGKYLDKKKMLAEIDQHFGYARDSLLAYAQWMVDNEALYLDKPDLLEYPNETWAVQDLRKSLVLHYAAKYAEEPLLEALVKKGLALFDGAMSQLERWETRTLTRPLVLFLQNYGAKALLQSSYKGIVGDTVRREYLAEDSTPVLSKRTVLQRIFKEFARALTQCRPKREIAWLRARLR